MHPPPSGTVRVRLIFPIYTPGVSSYSDVAFPNSVLHRAHTDFQNRLRNLTAQKALRSPFETHGIIVNRDIRPRTFAFFTDN